MTADAGGLKAIGNAPESYSFHLDQRLGGCLETYYLFQTDGSRWAKREKGLAIRSARSPGYDNLSFARVSYGALFRPALIFRHVCVLSVMGG